MDTNKVPLRFTTGVATPLDKRSTRLSSRNNRMDPRSSSASSNRSRSGGRTSVTKHTSHDDTHSDVASETGDNEEIYLDSFPEQQTIEFFATEGEPRTIQCDAPKGYPKPRISWIIQHSSGAIRSINSSRITIDKEGGLHFSNITSGDEIDDASYACSVASDFRQEYKLGGRIIFHVVYSGGDGGHRYPPIQQYVSLPNIVALREQPLELSCIIGGSPLPDVSWKKDGLNLETDRYQYLNYGKTLQIERVDFQDEGHYECSATNGIGQPFSHEMAVTVQSAPYWINAPSNTHAVEGEDVTFTCEAKAIPEPSLQWYVNGVPFEEAVPKNNRRKQEGNVLHIQRILKNDIAVYQCNASNVHGYAHVNFYLNVIDAYNITEDSKLETTDASNITEDSKIETTDAFNITENSKLGTRAVEGTLQCTFSGELSTTWLRSELHLAGGRIRALEDGSLEISDFSVTYDNATRNQEAKEPDEGENFLNDTFNATRNQIAPAEPDFKWSHLPNEDGKAAIQVTWIPSSTGGPPGSYFYVQYLRKGDDNWVTTKDVKNQDTLDIKGLEPSTLYEIIVVAVEVPYKTLSRSEEITTGEL